MALAATVKTMVAACQMPSTANWVVPRGNCAESGMRETTPLPSIRTTPTMLSAMIATPARMAAPGRQGVFGS